MLWAGDGEPRRYTACTQVTCSDHKPVVAVLALPRPKQGSSGVLEEDFERFQTGSGRGSVIPEEPGAGQPQGSAAQTEGGAPAPAAPPPASLKATRSAASSVDGRSRRTSSAWEVLRDSFMFTKRGVMTGGGVGRGSDVGDEDKVKEVRLEPTVVRQEDIGVNVAPKGGCGCVVQ